VVGAASDLPATVSRAAVGVCELIWARPRHRRLDFWRERMRKLRMAETKKDALVASNAFVEVYAIKYEKAVECVPKTSPSTTSRQSASNPVESHICD
jgi:hypothetical protein